MREIDKNNFWEWAFSDFLSNSLRGVLAEYIVATAVGCTHRPRVEWDAVDLETSDGLKIEVKSAAYLQSWAQSRPSDIRFDIAPRKGGHSATNTSASAASRGADIYVFCLFTATDRAQANPRDLSQWQFLACTAQFLTDNFGNQKSIALSMLERAGLQQFGYQALGARVTAVAPPRAAGRR